MIRAPWSRRTPRPLKPLPTREAEPAHQAKAQRVPVLGRMEAFGFFVAAGVILAAAVSRSGRPGAAAGAPGGKGPSVLGGVLDLLSAHPHAPAAAERAEPGRGRDAASPADIPPRGWRDVLARTWAEFGRDRIMSVAAGVTFFALLALFPAIGAFVSLYGLFADVHQAEHQLRLLRGIVPPGVIEFVGGEMKRIAAAHSGGLGLAFGISLLISLWSANGAVKALFDGLNVAYEERESRGLVKLNLISLAFTLGGLVFVALALSAVVVAPVLMHVLHLDRVGGAWLAELRWPVLLLITVGLISLIYAFGPSRTRPRWSWITWGGTFAAVLWVGASLLFSWYVANFAHYDKTYGSLGAVVGFMTWIWYSTIIVLFGAELNSELEHQTAVDTTVGAPKPMGARGAKMADTLGEALKPKLDKGAKGGKAPAGSPAAA